jgi:hypothetical protein
MRVLSRSRLVFSLTLGLILGLGVGAISVLGTGTGWLPGLFALVVYLWFALQRSLRRWRATRKPLPRRATGWLERHVRLYGRLGQDARERFETDVRIILDEWIFESVDEVEVTDEMRLGVAAGAALLMHGHPEWEMPYGQTVLFYPDTFDDEYLVEGEGDFEGMAHQQGPVILSVDALDESWTDGEDGRNVVLHELAHLLDYKTAFADGVPSLVDPRSTVAWQALVKSEMDRIGRGRSVLDDYGATEPAEFFAVAVETFFELPGRLRRQHPELFAALKAIFNLDPGTGLPPDPARTP